MVLGLSGAEEQEQEQGRQQPWPRAGRQSQRRSVGKAKRHGSRRLLHTIHTRRRLLLAEHHLRRRRHLRCPQLALEAGVADEAEDDLRRNRHG